MVTTGYPDRGRFARVRLLHAETVPYPPEIRARVLALSTPGDVCLSRLCRSTILGELFRGRRLESQSPPPPETGCHPPDRLARLTLCHLPSSSGLGEWRVRATFKLRSRRSSRAGRGITVASFRRRPGLERWAPWYAARLGSLFTDPRPRRAKTSAASPTSPPPPGPRSQRCSIRHRLKECHR